MPIHLLFDLIAYGVGTLLAWRVFRPQKPMIEDENLRYFNYTVVIVGAFVGAFAIGSLNTYYSLDHNSNILGKSVLGAIVGATISVEIFKKIVGLNGSTGAYFVPSLAIGIAIGRIGCFLAGLNDYTYGIPTDGIFGYDFGDGIPRHPVQLYESLVMALFFIYVLAVYFKNINYFEKKIFYQFILIYSSQRFIWEFLKPYGSIVWGLNIFQLFCLGLMGYSLYFLKK